MFDFQQQNWAVTAQKAITLRGTTPERLLHRLLFGSTQGKVNVLDAILP